MKRQIKHVIMFSLHANKILIQKRNVNVFSMSKPKFSRILV